MKSSFCIDLQRFMLIPTKFPLSPNNAILDVGGHKKRRLLANLLDLFVELFTAFYDCER